MTLETRQRYGCIGLILILIAVYSGRDVLKGYLFAGNQQHPYTDSRWGATVVELAGDTDRKGIYYIPSRTPVRRFLEMAGESHIGGATSDLDRLLVHGTALRLQGMDGNRMVLRPGVMGNAERLVLGMPMALNSATADELSMAEGIGPKTAARIVEKREEKGGFRSIDDLLEVKGIGAKKIRAFKKYFYIDSPR